jgi:Neutral/alkaline non-lysosomal ceramidase, N-terminal
MAGVATTWRAGAASRVITPAEPMWLAGWAVRAEPARSTLTNLHAKALALEDHQHSRLVLLTLDLIAISREIATAVAAQIQQRWGVPRERLTICASHTHCGPEVRPDKVPFFHIPPEYAAKIEPYVDRLTTRLVEVVGAALADMQPARLSVRQTTASFAQNRRRAAAVDHDVPVLEVTAPEGHRRAVLFGYACHNTTMPPADGRYCGDYAGFAQAELEADDDSAAAMFIAGAGADQDPEPLGTIDFARQHGHTLAEAVHQCLTTPGTGREITGPLRVAYEEVPLDFQPPPSRDALLADRSSDDLPTRTKAEDLLARLDRGEFFAASYPCPLQVAQLGDALLLIAIGGEPVIDYAHQLKRRYAAPGRVVWVAGYANDMFGYVPTARVLREGGYEGNRSVLWSALPAPFAENTEERILNGIDRLVEQLGRD